MVRLSKYYNPAGIDYEEQNCLTGHYDIIDFSFLISSSIEVLTDWVSASYLEWTSISSFLKQERTIK